MSLPKAFLDEIRARVPLSDVIGKRMKLTRAGREYKGCCPFHKEKTPSFTVNNEKGFYHCFGCGVHGDVIRFLTDHDNLKFMEAVEQLAGIAGMTVPKPTPEEAKKFQRQMSLYDLMEAAARYYEQQLDRSENKRILDYFLQRGLSLETVKSFRLGYAPEGDTLQQYLQKQGFKLEDMVDAGLVKKSERRQGETYPFFRHRVIFPVTDFQGRIVAFGGRVLPGADKEAPKYINSPETAIFHKGRNLYGLSRARKVIGDGETVIVVEGYMDVIALAQAGFRAAVAPLGTALTESQIEELWKVMPESGKNPVLCFDGDTAGQRAAGRAMERVLPILKPDHTVRFAFLPDGQDPDDLIKAEGRSAMQSIINNAVSLFEMVWQEESKGRNFNQPEQKAGFRAALEKRARQIADMSVQQFFIQEINQRVNDIFFSKTLNKKGATEGRYFKGKQQLPGAHTPYRPVSAKARPVRSSKFLREKILLAAMINHPALYEEFSEQFGMFKSESLEYDQLRQALIVLLSDEINLDDQAVKQHLITSGLGKTLEAVTDSSVYLHAGFAKPGQAYDVVRHGWLDTYERGLTQARLA